MNHCSNDRCKAIHPENYTGQCHLCGGSVSPSAKSAHKNLEKAWKSQGGGIAHEARRSLGSEGSGVPKDRVDSVKRILFGEAQNV